MQQKKMPLGCTKGKIYLRRGVCSKLQHKFARQLLQRFCRIDGMSGDKARLFVSPHDAGIATLFR